MVGDKIEGQSHDTWHTGQSGTHLDAPTTLDNLSERRNFGSLGGSSIIGGALNEESGKNESFAHTTRELKF